MLGSSGASDGGGADLHIAVSLLHAPHRIVTSRRKETSHPGSSHPGWKRSIELSRKRSFELSFALNQAATLSLVAFA